MKKYLYASFTVFLCAQISCIEMKRMAAMKLKEALHVAETTHNWESEDLGMIIKYYIQLPDVSTHENHVVGAVRDKSFII